MASSPNGHGLRRTDTLRVHRAKKLRAERRAVLAEDRAEERQVAMIMAEDRFALTEKGLAALRASRMA